MSAISNVSSYTSAATSTETGSTALGKDTFLRLLTTQLQNQDPTNPMSNEDFIAQLAQFSSLEQLQGVNGQLETMNLLNASMNNASMVNLLGQEVVALSDKFHYDGEGEQELMFDATQSFSSATVTVLDENGKVVDTFTVSGRDAGEGTATWDGKNSSGQVVEGDYSFEIYATDANGEDVAVTALVKGIIDEMSFSNGTAEPSVNGIPIDIGNIVRLSTGSAI